MAKAADPVNAALRAIPSVDRILTAAPFAPLIGDFGRERVKEAGVEVIVSRGELVEIGGAFRVPDVIQQGGAKLREVGTTNRTRARDYADAVSRKTAAMLRVHRSNFTITGFTETPAVEELVDVARKKKVPLLYDEGSGRVVDLHPYGFSAESTLED